MTEVNALCRMTEVNMLCRMTEVNMLCRMTEVNMLCRMTEVNMLCRMTEVVSNPPLSHYVELSVGSFKHDSWSECHLGVLKPFQCDQKRKTGN